MAAILVLHRVTLSADEEYYFLAPPNSYTGDIGTATGISKAADSEQDRPETPVSKLVSNGKLFRLAASYKVGTKTRSVKLLCARTKIGTALDVLDGASYVGRDGGGTLTSVRVTQKAIYSF